MKTLTRIGLTVVMLSAIAGCGGGDQAENPAPPASTPTAAKPVGMPLGSVKVGDQALCAVCAHEPGHAAAPEETKAVLDYKGKTYAFCSVDEKAKFISEPAKYAGAQ